MNAGLLVLIFVAAAVFGYFIIRNVPALLHTPLMSGMNALSGITVLGAIVAAAAAGNGVGAALGGAACVLAMINVTEGFALTGRMLRMFKRKEDVK